MKNFIRGIGDCVRPRKVEFLFIQVIVIALFAVSYSIRPISGWWYCICFGTAIEVLFWIHAAMNRDTNNVKRKR